jgi:hypothetical protein
MELLQSHDYLAFLTLAVSLLAILSLRAVTDPQEEALIREFRSTLEQTS